MNRLQKLSAQSVGDLVAEAIQIVCGSDIGHKDKLAVVDILGELGLRLRQADRLGPREEASS
jgi:hypothetical protein